MIELPLALLLWILVLMLAPVAIIMILAFIGRLFA